MNRKLNITSPLVSFTEPPMASVTGNTYGLTPEQIVAIATYNNANTGNTGNTGNKATGVLDSIFGGLSSVIDSTTNLIGGWFNRGTQVVDTNQKSSMSTGVLLLGAVLVVILVIFLMKKQ
jgi:hypothetical protein